MINRRKSKKLGIKKLRPSPMVELIQTLKQTATKIADLEPDLKDWTDWVSYLLEQLQVEAEKDFKASVKHTLGFLDVPSQDAYMKTVDF